MASLPRIAAFNAPKPQESESGVHEAARGEEGSVVNVLAHGLPGIYGDEDNGGGGGQGQRQDEEAALQAIANADANAIGNFASNWASNVKKSSQIPTWEVSETWPPSALGFAVRGDVDFHRNTKADLNRRNYLPLFGTDTPKMSTLQGAQIIVDGNAFSMKDASAYSPAGTLRASPYILQNEDDDIPADWRQQMFAGFAPRMLNAGPGGSGSANRQRLELGWYNMA